jgi:hypothetical protein
MAPTDRDYMLRVRMSREEQKMLQWLADQDGLTASDAVRQLVRRSHAERAGTASGTVKPKPKRK